MTSDKYAYVIVIILLACIALLGVEAYHCVKAVWR